MKEVKINFSQKIVNQYGNQLKDSIMDKEVNATLATVLSGRLLSLSNVEPKDALQLWCLCKDVAKASTIMIDEDQLEFLIKHTEMINAMPLIKGQLLTILKDAEKDLK